MAGISSKAFERSDYPENKKKYNGIEFEGDLDINAYDAQLRELDPQIGKWWQIDPKIESMEMWSPYASNYDNPIRYSDPLGDQGEECCRGLRLVLASTAGTLNGMLNSATMGLWPTTPISSTQYTDEELEYYNSGVKYGQMGWLPTSVTIPPLLAPRLVPAGGGPLISPSTSPPPVVPANQDRVNSTSTNNSSSNTPSTGKEKNKLKPDEKATGDHVVYKRDPNGNVYKYEEFKANPQNPTGFDSKKRFDGGLPDGGQGAPHYNKQTREYIETPQIQGKNIPSGVRQPLPWEIPDNRRFKPTPTGS